MWQLLVVTVVASSDVAQVTWHFARGGENLKEGEINARGICEEFTLEISEGAEEGN